MSEVRLAIRDARREICGETHGGFAESVIAALSAEPETIDELELALERFVAPRQGGHFSNFRTGVDDQPHDAGVVVVDLAARLVACESSYFAPGHEGWLNYHDGNSATDVEVGFHLSPDWEFVSYIDTWRGRADERRRERLANPPLDARAVLYGQPLLEFVARECLATYAGKPAPADADVNGYSEEEHNLARQIHAKWLVTARDDLRGAAPRDVLLARRAAINWDLQDREQQWSAMLRPPRPLDPRSAAYRFGGCGTHEIVTYYDLVRELIGSCRELVGRMPSAAGAPAEQSLAALVPPLAQRRDQWLDSPAEDFGNRVPRKLIHNERIRLPESWSGKDAMIDPDCPLCQLQADSARPGFWHLDGCNMDDDFAFSFHATREEFEAKQREQEEFDRRFEAEREERERLGVKAPGGGYVDPDYAWDRTFSDASALDSHPFIRLFTIGSHLCELTAALKRSTVDRAMLDRLSRDYGNLREVVQGQDAAAADALLQPVLDRFCESLAAVAAARPDLEAKCADLQDRLGRFTNPPVQSDDAPPDAEDEC